MFVDTENDGKKWTLNNSRELSFHSAKLDLWLFYDVDMDVNHKDQMQDFFNQLLNVFPKPVVLFITITPKTIFKELFGRLEEAAPNHSTGSCAY